MIQSGRRGQQLLAARGSKTRKEAFLLKMEQRRTLTERLEDAMKC